jgi:hypothetical protein
MRHTSKYVISGRGLSGINDLMGNVEKEYKHITLGVRLVFGFAKEDFSTLTIMCATCFGN